MAFKNIANFVDGIKFEDVKDKYNVSRRKIEKIVEQNETEKRSHPTNKFKQNYSHITCHYGKTMY